MDDYFADSCAISPSAFLFPLRKISYASVEFKGYSCVQEVRSMILYTYIQFEHFIKTQLLTIKPVYFRMMVFKYTMHIHSTDSVSKSASTQQNSSKSCTLMISLFVSSKQIRWEKRSCRGLLLHLSKPSYKNL